MLGTSNWRMSINKTITWLCFPRDFLENVNLNVDSKYFKLMLPGSLDPWIPGSVDPWIPVPSPPQKSAMVWMDSAKSRKNFLPAKFSNSLLWSLVCLDQPNSLLQKGQFVCSSRFYLINIRLQCSNVLSNCVLWFQLSW